MFMIYVRSDHGKWWPLDVNGGRFCYRKIFATLFKTEEEAKLAMEKLKEVNHSSLKFEVRKAQ